MRCVCAAITLHLGRYDSVAQPTGARHWQFSRSIPLVFFVFRPDLPGLLKETHTSGLGAGRARERVLAYRTGFSRSRRTLPFFCVRRVWWLHWLECHRYIRQVAAPFPPSPNLTISKALMKIHTRRRRLLHYSRSIVRVDVCCVNQIRAAVSYQPNLAHKLSVASCRNSLSHRSACILQQYRD